MTWGRKLRYTWKTPEGQAGFVHPVIIPKSNSFSLKGFSQPANGEVVPARQVHHFDFFARERYGGVEDWLHVNGRNPAVRAWRGDRGQAGERGPRCRGARAVVRTTI